MDLAVGPESLDGRIALRMQLSLDLFEAADAAFDLAQHDRAQRQKTDVDRSPAGQGSLEFNPPATPHHADEPLDDSGVSCVVQQGGPFPVELHSEVRAENGAGARPDGRTHRGVRALEPRDHRRINPDRLRDLALGNPSP
jgi:hypothetical protein